MNDSRPILIYDAECRLCSFSKEMMEHWDTKRHIRFLPFQDTEAPLLVPELASIARGGNSQPDGSSGAGHGDVWSLSPNASTSNIMNAMLLVDTNGVVLSGVDAFRGLLPSLPMGQAVAFMFKIPGVSMLAAKIYRVIAKNRIRWFGTCDCT